jgi:elongation factor 1-alpha
MSEIIESSKFVVIGNVDAGKSSFIGVMEKNVLDDGNGYARSLITKIKHEQETGRTSTYSFHYIVKNNEVTTMIDLCGHEKYLKTTMFGIMGLFCDYGIIVVGANMGLCGMAREHMGLLISNRIPFIVVVTKTDICPANILVELKKDLSRIAKRNKKEVTYFEDEEKEINGSYLKESHQSIIDSFHARDTTVMPVIMLSNKTGLNVEFTKELITSIRSQSYLERKLLAEPKKNEIENTYPMIMYIDSSFNIQGIGIVLSGTLKYGSIHLGQKVYVGPINNTYISVVVKSIHNCICDSVDVLKENESGSIGIRLETKGSFSREMFSKGQIITSDFAFAMKNTCYQFNCDVSIFNHPTTITDGYQTVIHCRTIRQAGKFKTKEGQMLRTNSKENIDIKFMQRPEFILPGTLFMFRDGRTKGMGRINSGIPFTEDSIDPIIRRKVRNAEEKKNKPIVKLTKEEIQVLKKKSNKTTNQPAIQGQNKVQIVNV